MNARDFDLADEEERKLRNLDHVLALWSNWMRKPDHLEELGYPAQSTGLQPNASRQWDDTSDLMREQVESMQIKLVDAAIDSLDRIQRISIEFEWINRRVKANVFRHPMLPEEFKERKAIYNQAIDSLRQLLEKRGMDV